MFIAERHEGVSDGVFYLSRAEDVMTELLKTYRHSVQMIYLDPPFLQKESLSLKLGRGQRTIKLPAENSPASFDAFFTLMREVLIGCRELLSPSGSLYLHTGSHAAAPLRQMLDEVFGRTNFQNEIIWSYKIGGRAIRHYPRRHDTIFYYRKSRKVYFDITAIGTPRGPARTNHMKRFTDGDGRTGFSTRARGRLYKYYDDDLVYPSDVWTDIEPAPQTGSERVGWATQKPEELLKRMLLASSREGDLVMDLFCGSGTTAAVSAALGRRFVVVDPSPLSLYTSRKRLLTLGSAPALGEKPAGSLSLAYPPAYATIKISSFVEDTTNGKFLVIKEAQVGKGNRPLVYVATGYADGDCFVTCHTNCTPALPIKLQLPENREAVLQLTNVAGEQGFIEINRAAP